MQLIHSRFSAADIISTALLTTASSLIIALWVWKAPAFIPDDAIFYLVIARNLALDGHHTFSGIMPTNGVHPLWLYLLSVYSWAVAFVFGPESLNNIRTALPLSAALLAGGCAVWWKIGRVLRVNRIALVSIPFAYLACSVVLYSEVHLLFFTLSLLVLSLVKLDDQRRTKWFVVGALSALVVLSRLDAVFAVVWLAALLPIYHRKPSHLVCAALAFSAIIIPYLASNHFIFGHIVPMSGYTKSSFPEVNFTGFGFVGVNVAQFQGYSIVFGIIPILFSLALWPTHKDTKTKLILSMILGGAILQFAQIALFSSSAHKGLWYYLLPIMAASISAASLLSAPLRPRRPSLLHSLYPAVALSAFFALTLLWYENTRITNFINLKPARISVSAESLLFLRKDNDTLDFWPPFHRAMEFIGERNIQDATIVVSDTPGGLAFYHPSNRIVAADFLTGNALFFNRMRASDNALRYLFDSAARIGEPVEYVMLIGAFSDWLTPSPNLRCAFYLDPMHFPDDHLIGRVHLGAPLELVEYDPGIYFIVWDAASPSFDVDADDPLCAEEDSDTEA